MDALVIFGATGDLAKLETFPALVGLVDRGVLDVPVVGVAKSGWELEQFRDYAAASLRHNGIDPASPPAPRCSACCATSTATSTTPPRTPRCRRRWATVARALYYLEVPPPLFGRIAKGIATAGRADGARVMVEKPFGTDLAERAELNPRCTRFLPGGRHLPGRPLARPGPARERAVRPVRQRDLRAAAEPTYVESVQITMAEAFDVSDRGSFYDRTAPSATSCRTTCCRFSPASSRSRRPGAARTPG